MYPLIVILALVAVRISYSRGNDQALANSKQWKIWVTSGLIGVCGIAWFQGNDAIDFGPRIIIAIVGVTAMAAICSLCTFIAGHLASQ